LLSGNTVFGYRKPITHYQFLTRDPTQPPAKFGVVVPADLWAFDTMRRGPLPQTLPPRRNREHTRSGDYKSPISRNTQPANSTTSPTRHASAPMRQRCTLRPVQASKPNCTECAAARASSAISPGLNCQASKKLPFASAAQARVPPHNGQGKPVTCRKPHSGRSPSDSTRGAPNKAIGQPSARAERHWRSGGLSRPLVLLMSAMCDGGGHRSAVGQLFGHVVTADEANGQREDHANTAQQAADGADDAQHQRTKECAQ